MKRPLALVGACVLFTQLLAVFLPQTALWLSAAFLVCAFFGSVLLARRGCRCAQTGYAQPSGPKPALRGCRWPLLAAGLAMCAALLLRMGVLACTVAPVQARAGTQSCFTADVVSTGRGFIPGTVSATVRVVLADGQAPGRPFLLQVPSMPAAQAGERVSFTAVPETVAQDDYQLSWYAKGVYLEAPEIADFSWDGDAPGLRALFARVRTACGRNVRRALSGDIGTAAAAMAFGDKTQLTSGEKALFRGAGLSHLLVVSGLHASLVGGTVFAALRRLPGRRARRCAAAVSIGVLLLFAAVVGFTPSVVRASFSLCLLYGGCFADREPDALTSLGLSALVLCALNPYAAADAGLLLSYSATLAILGVGRWDLARRVALEQVHAPLRARLRQRLAKTLLLPAAACLSTIPVLTAIGGGVSLLTVLCNLLAAPFVSGAVLGGLVLGLCGACALFSPLAGLGGVVSGVCVRVLLAICTAAGKVPGAMIYFQGAVPVCVLAALAALVGLGLRWGVKKRVCVLLCAVFVLLAGAGYAALDQDVVRVAAVGPANQPSLVVTQGLHTAVLFRGTAGAAEDVQEYLAQNNRSTVDLLLDLRREADDTAALQTAFAAKQAVCVEQEVQNRIVLRPFYGIIVTAGREEKGCYAAVNADGYSFALAAGHVDFGACTPFSVFFSGAGTPENLRCSAVLTGNSPLRWTPPASAALLHPAGTPVFVLRGGKSYQIKGAVYDPA